MWKPSFHRFVMPKRRRLTYRWLSIIIIATLIVCYWIAWDRTRGNQRRLDKAVVLMSQGHHEESLGLYEKVLKRWPRAKLALTGKGLCELNLGRYDEALESYTRIIDIDPSNIQGLDGQGMSYEKLGKLDDAIRCYRRIDTIKPNVLDVDNRIERLIRLKKITVRQPSR